MASGVSDRFSVIMEPSSNCCAPKPFRLTDEVYIHANGDVEKFDIKKTNDIDGARARTIHRFAMKVIVPDEVKELGLIQFKHVVPYLGKTG